MTLTFNIEYRTNWGEEVKVWGSIPELGDNNPEKALSLKTIDGIKWAIDIEINSFPANNQINYTYGIFSKDKLLRKEWSGVSRCLHLSTREDQHYYMWDSWKLLPGNASFFSSAFTNSFLAPKTIDKKPRAFAKGLVIKAYAPELESKYALGISGNQESLGNWNSEDIKLLSNINSPEWQIELNANVIQFPLEYKFVLFDKNENKIVQWENIQNRYISDPKLKSGETSIIGDQFTSFNITPWRGTGVAIPVFSLKSENSFGVGDFGDLKRLVDWAKITKQKVIQILPINDTTITHTWTDSYPYNSISIYAFHPMYIDISQLPALKNKTQLNKFKKLQKELNELKTVDYEAVNNAKWDYLELLFKQEGAKTLKSKSYLTFFENNKEWLQAYAVFSHLRDVYKTANFREWPKHNKYSDKLIKEFCDSKSASYNEISLYFFIQFILHEQLVEARTYAHSQGIVLKGDIPIGISRDSVEAWKEDYYFHINGQAGAPPDAFSTNGQNWGFPTYNWEAMQKDGYAWWVKRFQKMAEYFDAYRIDHILGFFRIWEIPMNAVHGLLGQFSPALPMSREEIGNYGLYFREDFFTSPYIHESFLEQIFGPYTNEVKDTFIETTNEWERYKMRSDFDTQKKVEKYFGDKEKNEKNTRIRDGLYSLISNVLFLRDHKNPDLFHPRIAVQHDFIYHTLNYQEKEAFNRLYNHFYYHRHNSFWADEAMKKLPLLTQSTQMLVCGEDLGMIPSCVEWVMNQLQILSLEIQRMPKDDKVEFANLYHYPYRSVCTISTHDMSTLRGYWTEDRGVTQRYFNQALGHWGEAPEVASADICEEIVRNHLYTPSMLCILSFQDWLSIDEQWRNPDIEGERINIPANPKHYWKYRMHMTIEELINAESLNEKIIELTQLTGRDHKL